MKYLLTATAFNADQRRTKDENGEEIYCLYTTPLKSDMERQLQEFKIHAAQYKPDFILISTDTTASNAVRKFYCFTLATGKTKAITEIDFCTAMDND